MKQAGPLPLKKRLYLVLVLAIELPPTVLPFMLRFQFEHDHVRDKRLHLLTDILRRPVAHRHMQTHIDRRQEGRMSQAIMLADIRTEHVHPLQERLIEGWQLRVLEPTLPVVCHQLIVGPQGM